jgi:hypothetical protein
MSDAPSAGWREVYEWCHVDPPDKQAGQAGLAGRLSLPPSGDS